MGKIGRPGKNQMFQRKPFRGIEFKIPSKNRMGPQESRGFIHCYHPQQKVRDLWPGGMLPMQGGETSFSAAPTPPGNCSQLDNSIKPLIALLLVSFSRLN